MTDFNLLQGNYFSQANSVAGSYVLGVMFYKFWGLMSFREWLKVKKGTSQHLFSNKIEDAKKVTAAKVGQKLADWPTAALLFLLS